MVHVLHLPPAGDVAAASCRDGAAVHDKRLLVDLGRRVVHTDESGLGFDMPVPVSFHRDDVLLRGTLHQAQGRPPYRTILLLHGSPAEKGDVLGLGSRWAHHGFNVLTFSPSGNLDSEGLSSFENTQLDISAATRFIGEDPALRVDDDQFILGGWSYGGGMAITYAANNPSIRSVFSISGTDHAEFLREYDRDPEYRRMVDAIFDSHAVDDSEWRLEPGATPREFHESGGSLDGYDFVLLAPRLADRRVLLIGGWDDINIKIETHVLPLYRALKRLGSSSVSILAFGDDHSFAKSRDALADAVLDWIEQGDSAE